MGIQSRVGQEAAAAPPAGGRSAAQAAMLLTAAGDAAAAQTVNVSKDLLKTTVADHDDGDEAASDEG
ncbi:MAG: hypothetical protein J2P24_13600 [Streptosporangiales bacterium]|nr:hypothetical protein [Streptosporangiales bacterium]